MSPLLKRTPRAFTNNPGRYLALFLLLTFVVAFFTGYMASAHNISNILDGMYDRYTVRDAKLVVAEPLDAEALEAVEAEGVRVVEEFSYDLPFEHSGGAAVARVYSNRSDADLAAYYEGVQPSQPGEIAVDRVFAEHNGLGVGDSIEMLGDTWSICGIMSLSDAQAMFENNNDFLFNAQTFTVAEVAPAAFEALSDQDEAACIRSYALVFDERGQSTRSRMELEGAIQKDLEDLDIDIDDFVDSSADQSIGYAASDVSGDSIMYEVFLGMIIVIMGFVFVILSNAQIEEESSAIGTLLAMGYRNRDLIVHYMMPMVLLALAAAIIGNLVGYLFWSEPMQGLYYNSYSLPPYEQHFSVSVLIITTIVPIVLLLGITFVGLFRRLSLTPLQFLRHDNGKESHRHEVQLSERMGFMSRFRIRAVLRNAPNYLTLLAGVIFGSILLLFGFCLLPIVANYADELKTALVAEHTYVLRDSVEPEQIGDAERFAAVTLQVQRAIGGGMEDVTVYGIQEDSDYWDFDVSHGEVVVDLGLSKKCDIASGETFTLKNEFSSWKYDLVASDVSDSEASTNVYMSIDDFNELFTRDPDFYNGWVSNAPLKFSAQDVMTHTTPSDMDKITDQITDSMSTIASMFIVVAIFIYLVLMYLLTKTVIDRSARNISYMKVFGYRNREVNALYLTPITITVIASLLISLPITIWALTGLTKLLFMAYSGNFPIVIGVDALAKIFAMGVATYAVVALLHVHRIRRVPMSIALKVQE